MQLINDESRICYDKVKKASVLLTLILTTLTSFQTPCNQYALLKPGRPDFSPPWNAPGPSPSPWFHTALKMPFFLFLLFQFLPILQSHLSPTSSKEASQIFYFVLSTVISVTVSPHILGLNFASSLSPTLPNTLIHWITTNFWGLKNSFESLFVGLEQGWGT